MDLEDQVFNVNGFWASNKTCLATKGFSQVEGIYFNEAVCFVAQMEPNSNYACNCNKLKYFKMHQMDVQTNFLDENLLDYIYIYIYKSKGFAFKGKKNMV
jgi:hypothetical protein